MLQLVLNHAFNTPNLNRARLRVFASDLRARPSNEKAAFRLEGTLRQAVFRHGKYIDVHVVSILRAEWKNHQEG